MKNTLFTLALFGSLAASAQKTTNKLLDQGFWKDKPDVTAVKAAVESGANPSEKNSNAFDPVVLAINSDQSKEVIDYLLAQKGNEVSKITHDARIYLHWAAFRGNVAVVKDLIAKGSKVSLEDSHGTTPLLFAAGAGITNTEVFESLIKAGVNPKTEVNQAGANALLVSAANDKDLKLTDYWLSKGLDLNSKDANGDNAFSYAARSGNIELLKAFKAKGVKPTDGAFLFAASGGGRRGPAAPGTPPPSDGMPVFEYLESIGLKPTAVNKEGQNILHLVARKPNQVKVINYFMSKGVNPTLADKEGNTPFMLAAANNRDLATVELLTSKVTNINQANVQGTTALAGAVRSNSAEVVKYLIEKGAKLDAVDQKGDNLGAYILQAYNPRNLEDFDAKVAILQEKGFDFTKPQGDGSSLYHLAAVKGDIALLKKVTNLKVDVNAKNKDGVTALQKAAMVAKDDTELKYLLSIGADKAAKTGFGETAFDLASENETLSKKQIAITFLK